MIDTSSFSKSGFIILPKFFPGDFIDEVCAAIHAKKLSRPMDVVVDRMDINERTVLGFIDESELGIIPMKINDLFLSMKKVREVALNTDLAAILKSLLKRQPVLCNSLYFEHGSVQPMHVDTLYMTPQTRDHLIASWVALEDVHEDAGQLMYYPRSHLIEPMKFSNGGYHAIDSEMPEWQTYIEKSVTARGLKKEYFAGRKGDVFIWHANLLHGGAAIKNSSLTRKSLVFHYYSDVDATARSFKQVPMNGAAWIDRLPLALPDSIKRPILFSEEAYLARYPDVEAAVKRGDLRSGRQHYEEFGKSEGRIPN